MSAQRRTTTRSEPVAATVTADKTDKRTRPPKPKPSDPNRREVLMARTDRMRGLFQDTLSEVRKVNWPDQETTRNLTIVVIGISVAMGILLGGIDYLLVQLLGLF
jgi:preprotein translocase subunit SecE